MKALHIIKDPKKVVAHQDKRVFGAALDPSATTIPRIMENCVVYLDATGLDLEGVFRKSGSLQQLKDYRARIDNGENVDFSDVTDPHIVAGLLKLYIREYPEPLLTFELYDCFLAAVAIPDVTVKVPKVKQVLSMLPSANLMIVKYLVAFLCRVSARSDVNFMTPANLAIVFAPNLLRPPYEGDEGIGIMMEDTPFANQLLQLFINHYDALFSESKPNPPSQNNTVTKIIGSSGKPTPPKKPSHTRQSSLPPPPSIPLPIPPSVSSPPPLPSTPAPSLSSSTSPSASTAPPRPSTPPPKPPSVLTRMPSSTSHPLPPPPSPAPSLPNFTDTPHPPPKPSSVHNVSQSPPSNESLVVSPRNNALPPTPSTTTTTTITTNEDNHFTPTPPPKPLANNPYRRSVKPLPTAPAPSTLTTNSLDLAKRLPAPPMTAK